MDRAPENEGRMKDDAEEHGNAANSIRDRRRAFIHTELAVTGGYPVDLPSESALITNAGGKELGLEPSPQMMLGLWTRL